MKMLIKVLLSSLAVLIIGHFLPGIGIASIPAAVLVAVVLGLLNTFVRPLLVLLTIPVTILTLGLFLLVINAGMVLLAGRLVDGFSVDGWISALMFSVMLSVIQWILYKIFVPKKGRKKKDD